MENDELKTKLTELGLTDEQIDKLVAEGAVTDEDIARLTADEIRSVTECGLVTAKKVAEAFAPVSTAASVFSPVASLNVLPAVPTDENWLASLKVGGILKFNPYTVTGTVSAALASRVGLYDLPDLLIKRMEEFAEALEEPVPLDFYEMQRLLTERSYAEIFAAIPGATGRYATQSRRRELLGRMETHLWPSLMEFQGILTGWFDSWQKTAANPAMLMSAFTALVSGGGAVMPPGMMAPPPIDPLRDSAENVITNINRIFAGTGTVVAMALAYDAQQIRSALENPSLPAQVGAANREQMLRMLGVAVASDYPRLEQNLKQYTLGVVELPNVTAGQTELAYVMALYYLGTQISWDKLVHGGNHSVGKVTVERLAQDPAYVRGDRPAAPREMR